MSAHMTPDQIRLLRTVRQPDSDAVGQVAERDSARQDWGLAREESSAPRSSDAGSVSAVNPYYPVRQCDCCQRNAKMLSPRLWCRLCEAEFLKLLDWLKEWRQK
jgi:hypothetical protein